MMLKDKDKGAIDQFELGVMDVIPAAVLWKNVWFV